MITAPREDGTHSVLEVRGALRFPMSGELRRSMRALVARGERRVVLDLSRLTAIDAAGVGELVCAFNMMRVKGGVLQVVNARGRVRYVLDITGVSKLLAGGSFLYNSL